MTAFRTPAIVALVLSLGIAGCGETSPDVTPPRDDPAPRPDSPRNPEPPPAGVSEGRQAAVPVPAHDTAPDPVFRPDDDRPRHNDEVLAQLGIRRYESRRLILYSDIDPQRAVRLPPLADALYDALTAYFGPLPAARDGSEWQITGYVIGDADRFTSAGLMPSNLPPFHHGLHRGRRFWMHEQSLDYYLAHLLLHEATHCFMTTVPAPPAPVWYMEGMAEHFAAHRTTEDGVVHFAIFPRSPEDTSGFDRVTLIRKEVDAGRVRSLDEVFALEGTAFTKPVPYAWSWAACQFFDAQPACHDRFRELGAVAIRGRFRKEFDARFMSAADKLRVQWQHFVRTLCYGYDLQRGTLALRPATTELRGPVDVPVDSTLGWQSLGVRLKAGKRYRITAEGTASLAEAPQPWRSDANGITVDYADGRPIGRLLAAIIGDDLEDRESTRTLFDPIDVGSAAVLVAPIDGSLYLRINDHWNSLADNRGRLSVQVRETED